MQQSHAPRSYASAQRHTTIDPAMQQSHASRGYDASAQRHTTMDLGNERQQQCATANWAYQQHTTTSWTQGSLNLPSNDISAPQTCPPMNMMIQQQIPSSYTEANNYTTMATGPDNAMLPTRQFDFI